MKKFLSLLMMSLLCVAAWASTVTFTFNTAEGLAELGITPPAQSAGTNLGGTYTLDGVTMSFTNGGTATRVWNSQGDLDLRVYNNGGSLTFTAEEAITSVVFTSANNTIGNLTPDSGTLADGTWTGSATSVTFTAGATTRINTIEVTYGGSAPVAVAAPVITFDPLHPYEGEETTCTITCETEDATIMYALNDGEFQLYTEPFTLTETTTVKAKAVVGTSESEEVTKTVTFDPTVANIAALTQLTNGTYFKMTGEAVVVYVYGGYLYIKDDTGSTLIYNSTADGIAAGNTISNLKGKVSIYKNLFEVASATYDFEATQIAVEPVVMAIPDITADNMNQYVVIKGVTLSDVNGRNMKLNDADGNQFAVYSQYFCEFPEDLEQTYDVTGFVAVFNTTVQMYPVSFDVAEEDEDAVYYVTGGFNGWNNDEAVEIGEEGATITVAAQDLENPDDTAQEFKVITYDAEGATVWFGGADDNGVGYFEVTEELLGGEISLDTPGANFRLPEPGTYNIKLVQDREVVEGMKIVVTAITTGINAISAKNVASVRYINVAGITSDKAFDGLNIVVTTYTDGTKAVTKVVK